MKKVKSLCIAAVVFLGIASAPGFSIEDGEQAIGVTTVQAASNKTYTVNSSSNLASTLKKAKSGDTVIVQGAIKSAQVEIPSGVTLKGENGKIDFSLSAKGKPGIKIKGSNCKVQDLQIYNAKDNGIYITGNNNRLENLNVHDCADSGVQLCNGAANNYLHKVHSHHNVDKENGGENADGFAIKLHSGEGNVLERCVANNNSDDVYDCYAAHGAITFKKCQANDNGECYGIKGDGNGFKLGGVDNKTSGVKPHLDPLNHTLIDCSAKGNTGSGFDRNNQNGVVTMTRCTGDSNKKANFNWPASGKPSALGYKVTFGRAQIIECISMNGKNNITGADLHGNCQGF